ncbi:MAG: hypothetical protein JWM68_5174 [Verrucomicrobiales bacterium]|nr:hypothetical protein [Verrucomicrobiales bacterium]
MFLICVAVFSPVYQADFVHWDDDLNITGNPHIQKLNGENLRWMFTDFSFMRRYVPMSWLTWGLTCHFFGLNPRAFHLEGLLLHAINAVLLFFLLKKLLSYSRKEESADQSTLAAALGAFLWAIHPLRVEVVAWANCQMYAQSLLFVLLATFVYLRATSAPSANKNRLILLSAFLFLLSLLTYPTAIAFVVVLLVMDVFLLGRLPMDPRRWLAKDSRSVLLEKIPFVVATLAVAGVTLWARAHMTDFWKVADRIDGFSWPSRIAQAFYIWAYYVWKPWVSFEWSPVYTQLVSFGVTDWPFIVSSLAVIGITIWLVAKRARWPWALALWICHLALLVPMLGLTEHPHYPNDRYNYLAAIIGSLLVALFVRMLPANRRTKVIAAFLVFGTMLAAFSFQQTKIWRNSNVLFSTVIQKLGNDPYRADIYWRLGKTFAAENDFARAIPNYQKSLELFPSSAPVHILLAEALFARNQTNDAIAEYELAVKSDPRNGLAHYNLGILFERQDKPSEAIPHFRSASEADTNHIDAYNGLSRSLAKSGQIEQAMVVLQQTLRIDPANAIANFNLGNACMQQNKIPEALAHFAQAVKTKPDFADAHYQLGSCLAMTGRIAEALPHFVESTRLKPTFAPGFLALGMASSQTRQFASAINAYNKALQINPDFMQALINLGWILASHNDANLRNGPEALRLAQHAVELSHEGDPDSLDLLAAAYAECKKFPEAATTVSKAISVANAKGESSRATQLEARLELYRSGQPLRQ